MPIWKYHPHKLGNTKSAFESNEDYTCKVQSPSSQRRWRFEGPWLANLTEEEYLSYLHHRVKHRRAEFRSFLQDAIPKERHSRLKRSLRDRGESEAAVTEFGDQHGMLDDTELDMAIRELRKDPENLDQYIAAFLDLPRNNDTLKDGPPSTHPSAGLSYQRSHAHTANHPLYGPQEFRVPIEARVLLPQRDARGYNRPTAVLGIVGIAHADIVKAFDSKGNESAVGNFSTDDEGGPRVWVQLDEAAITPEGRIQLRTTRAESPALDAKGVTDASLRTQRQPSQSPNLAPLSKMPSLTGGRPQRGRAASGYGLEASSFPRSERAKPIEDPQKSLMGLLRKTAGE